MQIYILNYNIPNLGEKEKNLNGEQHLLKNRSQEY